MADRVCVGAVAGAFGTGGALRIKSFTADPAAIADYGPLELPDGRRLEVVLIQPIKGGFAARLSGIEDRDAAEALRGARLYVPRARLPSLPEDEFYHADLIGLEVVDTGGVTLGRVRAVLDHGAGDLLEVEPEGGGRPVLMPFTTPSVPKVDLRAGQIVVDPPDGVFD